MRPPLEVILLGGRERELFWRRRRNGVPEFFIGDRGSDLHSEHNVLGLCRQRGQFSYFTLENSLGLESEAKPFVGACIAGASAHAGLKVCLLYARHFPLNRRYIPQRSKEKYGKLG